MERSNFFFYQNVASGERAKKMINPLVLPAAARRAQRVGAIDYIGTICWFNDVAPRLYLTPGRPFGRPGGHAGARPRRGLLKLLRPTGQSKS